MSLYVGTERRILYYRKSKKNITVIYSSYCRFKVTGIYIRLNYQKALMKPYADAGMSTFASATGYRAETLTKLLNASNFKKKNP